ncbi:class I glutamine amidotransferase-like protein [Auricularia subglabra TFB-10046 SS5]|nr:class I glutamine amidotransferase-like protein [Auricularia subglabra TFB-10046 SS5]
MAQEQLNIARVLIYSATAGYRHESIPAAVDALKRLGPDSNIQFDSTEDRSKFTDDDLKVYDGLLFMMNTQQVLDDDGTDALQRYLNAGGNFIAVHSASDCLLHADFFGHEVGAYFDYHPLLQNATIVVLDKDHPSTSMLPERWPVHDEIYNFKSDPRSVGAKVILSVDESSYTDDGTRKFDQGTPHPIAWYQEKGAGADPSSQLIGRSWYTALGHDVETWKNETFLAHVMGGVSWALASGTTRAFNADASVGNNDSSTKPKPTSPRYMAVALTLRKLEEVMVRHRQVTVLGVQGYHL